MSLNSSWRAIIRRSQESPKARQQRRFASRRRLARFELFEPRMMLSYTPLQVATAYGYNNIMYGSVVGNGAGQTVAIIDPGDDANFVNTSSPNFSKSDLAKFDADYGLPNPPSFKVVGEDGGTRPRIQAPLQTTSTMARPRATWSGSMRWRPAPTSC